MTAGAVRQGHGQRGTRPICVCHRSMIGSETTAPSPQPVFVATDDDAFFVRFDNSTRRLTPRQTMDYVRERWPGG